MSFPRFSLTDPFVYTRFAHIAIDRQWNHLELNRIELIWTEMNE